MSGASEDKGEMTADVLRGPWHPDEMGMFNDHGWGFTVLMPEEWWGVEADEFPDDVRAVADLLEQTIRAHLNGHFSR